MWRLCFSEDLPSLLLPGYFANLHAHALGTYNVPPKASKSGAITMSTESHAKSQNWINSLYIILLLVITRPIYRITRKFVFQVVPDPKRRCSRPKTEAFQLCSQAVPEVFQKLFQVCSRRRKTGTPALSMKILAY